MSARPRVAVIAGGLSFEREVSLHSGRRVADGLRTGGYEVLELDAGAELVNELDADALDVAFLALHGRLGEDGAVPAMLEVVGLPYTGSGFDACRLAFDKLAAKAALRRARIPVPDAIPLAESAVRELGAAAVIDRALEELGLPVVVKPNRGGSAMGVAMVQRADELRPAIMAAFGYDDVVLLERAVAGSELAVGVVDGLSPLPAVEIRPKSGWYDFAARYSHGAVAFTVPALLDAGAAAQAQQLARAAHLALGCRDLSRVDMVLDAAGTCWVLEVNSAPGLTETSLVPMAAEAAGIAFADLAAHLTERALARKPR